MRTRTWNPHLPEVPVDEKGNWLAYPTYEHKGWETIYQPFPATLEIVRMETGRSAKRIILRDVERNKTYPMFVADLLTSIQHGRIVVAGGRLTGYWTASKKGANYGIKAVPVEY